MTNNNNIPTILCPGWGGETDQVRPEMGQYANGRTAIKFLYFDEEMQGWFPHATLTINLPDQHMNDGEIFIKDYSENELLAATLLEFGWITLTGREVSSGYVFAQVARPAGPLLDYINSL
jgi:hypothetical protein